MAAYRYLAFAWYALLFVLAPQRTGRLRLLPSVLVAATTVTTIGLLQFTFIR